MSEKNQEVVKMNELMSKDFVIEMEESERIFCSIVAETEEDKVKLFNVMNSPSGKVADMINMEIAVSDVVVETVRVTDDDGEEAVAPRIILVTPDGDAYQCVSNGVYSALKKVFKIFGAPHWDAPKRFTVRQIKKGNNSVLTLEMMA